MKREREPDPIWDAAVGECYPSGVATGMRKEVNGLVRDLKDLHATAAEIHRRAGLYREYCVNKDLMFSLRGLVRRWDQFPLPRKRPPEIAWEQWQDDKGRYWARQKPTGPGEPPVRK